MANLLWGQVYYQDLFAGIIREETGERVTFTYDSRYIEQGHPAIAHTLPLRSDPYISHRGLRFTPSYDQVAASLYQYKTLALGMAGSRDRRMGSLASRHLVILGQAFGLSSAAINMAVKGLAKNIEAAKEGINQSDYGTQELKDQLIKQVGKRWNAMFGLIGKALSSRQ